MPRRSHRNRVRAVLASALSSFRQSVVFTGSTVWIHETVVFSRDHKQSALRTPQGGAQAWRGIARQGEVCKREARCIAGRLIGRAQAGSLAGGEGTTAAQFREDLFPDGIVDELTARCWWPWSGQEGVH